MTNLKYKKLNKGQAVITSVIFFLLISTTMIIGVSSSVSREAKLSHNTMSSKESYFLAESGQEDVIFRLKNGMLVSDSEDLTIGSSIVSTTITDSFGSKVITSNATSDSLVRNVKTALTLGDGAAFNFGVQSGLGGFIMDNNAGVNGNVYSNGQILGDAGAFVTGSAISAGGLIADVSVGTTGVDEAWAETVTGTSVTGPLYCQSGSGNNKTCDTSRLNPETQPYPISDSEIDEWKAEAEAGGIIEGNYAVSGAESLGPVKITGNLTFGNNATLKLTGKVWVVGNITTSNNSIIKVDASYGPDSEVIFCDGNASLSNNTSFQGSGTEGSYILLLSNSSSDNAISVSNNAGAVILNAQKGGITFSNNSGANQATASRIFLDNNAVITYESGLVDVNFKSGPGGGYELNSWEEVE